MDFDIPRGVILPVDRVDVSLDPRAASVRDGQPGGDRCQLARARRRPTRRCSTARCRCWHGSPIATERLEGACHTIRFATFLYWRKTRPWPGAEHAFAHAIPVTSDGALIAIRMGRRTANPGKVYFAAGSFDPQDFPGGKVDVDLNMAREVAEETGLDIAGLPRDPHYHALSGANGTVIVRRYFLPQPADAVAAVHSRLRGARSRARDRGAGDHPERRRPARRHHALHGDADRLAFCGARRLRAASGVAAARRGVELHARIGRHPRAPLP